ncbi:MAG TPA: type III secretion system inner membrane ring subunit SctD [Rhabdochlamydiaceae bacterium]|nr:type III secretion system inner membrane ring subunit SctD [Rhabdochlamydiaceae bacterium]
MAGYLIAEEGPLTGMIIRFEEGTEWSLGRDPDESSVVLEDPMVSRKHLICRLTPEGYQLENLSFVNPATQNGRVISGSVLLREGDIIQIGSTFFRFSEKQPEMEEKKEAPPSEEESLSAVSFISPAPSRWLLKVVSGPNSGAEFSMGRSSVYIIGKDPSLCDIVFQDLSVSRQHARITVDDQENVYIEDLGSRNGVLVNGSLITDKHLISSQDLISLGTTTFLIIDREQVSETIVSPPSAIPIREEVPAMAGAAEMEARPRRDWREMIIPTKHLVIGGVFVFLIFLAIFGMFSLFKAEPVVSHEKNEQEQIHDAIKMYPDIQFSFNTANSKLFLVGHVLTAVDKQELMYMLHSLPFITNIEDNVVVDEYVWQNMNALLMTNPDWLAVSIHSPSPGHFVMRGYLQTPEQAAALQDFVNVNFPYLDRLDNQVVVESDLMTQIQGMLTEKGFSGVTFQLTNGELLIAGRVDAQRTDSFDTIINQFKHLRGVRMVKNFVVYTTAESSRIDISTQYKVTGYSKKDETNFYVVINGKILAQGEMIDGMMITSIQSNVVLLEKDGLKFKINYNLQ